MKKLLKRTSAMIFIIIGLSVTLTGCGTGADNSSMGGSSSLSGAVK